MLKSKLRSRIKQLQDTNQISQALQFLPLAIIHHGKLQLQEQGLAVLDDQLQGKTFLVGNLGSTRLIKAIYRCRNLKQPANRPSSGLWITNYPRYDRNINEQTFFIDMVSNSQEESMQLHVLCSVICQSILIQLEDNSLFGYLNAVKGRVIFSSQGSQNQNNRLRQLSLSSLIFYDYALPTHDRSVATRGQKQINELLQRNGSSQLTTTCRQYYQGLHRFSFNYNQINQVSPDYLGKVQGQIRRINRDIVNQDQDLVCGPVLRSYIQALTNALNRSGMVEIKKIVKSIEVSHGYNGYLRAVQHYHNALSRQLREQGNPNIQETLDKIRQQSIQQYKKQSNDANYLYRLNNHIADKQRLLIQQNNKSLQLQNINYLKKQSDHILNKISREKINEEQGQRLVGQMVEGYKSRGMGDNKYELLSQYLQIVNPAIFKAINQRDNKNFMSELDKSKEDKKRLENQLRDLERQQRENSKKCCQIM